MSSHTNTNDSGDKSEFLANLNVLRQIEFFSGVSMEVMKLFSFLCQRQSYAAGEYIFRQDDDDQCSYYILSGAAQLVFTAASKRYEVREYETESFFGALSLLTPVVKPFSLVATQDTICLVMTRKAVSKVVDQFPDLPLIIIRAIGQRVLMAERKCMFEFESNQNKDLKNLLGISLI